MQTIHLEKLIFTMQVKHTKLFFSAIAAALTCAAARHLPTLL